MEQLLHSAFIEALGWSLIDSLWQVGALWGVYNLVTLNGRKYSASVRHNLALLSVNAGTLWFLFSLFLNYYQSVHREHLYSLSYFFREGVLHGFGNMEQLNDVVSVLSVIYLAAMTIYTVGLMIRTNRGQNRYRNSVAPATHLMPVVNMLRDKLRIRRTVSLFVSAKTPIPFTSGWLHPLILLPASVLSQLTPSQVEAILAHELYHIRRNDYVLNLALIFTEVVLFFNPFARMLSAAVRKERENRCDDKVVSMGYDAWEYSQALFLLGNAELHQHALAIAASGSGKKLLLERIKRLLKRGQEPASVVKPALTFFLCLGLAVFTGRSHTNVNVMPAVTQNHHVVATVDRSAPGIPGEKTFIKQESTIILSTPAKTEITIECKKITSPKKTEPPAPTGEVAQEQEQEPEDLFNMPVFINESEDLEFTIIIPDLPETPQVILGERPIPYVPDATFYSPDSLPIPRKELKIIRI